MQSRPEHMAALAAIEGVIVVPNDEALKQKRASSRSGEVPVPHCAERRAFRGRGRGWGRGRGRVCFEVPQLGQTPF
jgi:hypothetical protein